MPRTKSKPRPKAEPVADVLTLAEAAAYLRVAEDEVVRLAREQNLPGQPVGAEWRFHRAALQGWLMSGPPRKSSKASQLATVGIFKDDPTLGEMVMEIYRRRGRSEDDVRELGELFDRPSRPRSTNRQQSN